MYETYTFILKVLLLFVDVIGEYIRFTDRLNLCIAFLCIIEKLHLNWINSKEKMIDYMTNRILHLTRNESRPNFLPQS